MENPGAKFNLYFLGYRQPGDPEHHTDGGDPVSSIAPKEGLVELTWNYGTENDANFKYHNGNSEPLGYGVIDPLRLPDPSLRPCAIKICDHRGPRLTQAISSIFLSRLMTSVLHARGSGI